MESRKSRVHALRHFGQQTWVKRDDELGLGISGSKYRKIKALIPKLLAHGYEEVVAIGGARSNNLIALFQACHEAGIKLKPFVLGSPLPADAPNNWLPLFCELDDIIWVDRQDWESVEEEAHRYTMRSSIKSIVMPEGCYHPWAFEGSLTLADEIVSYQASEGVRFDRIFVDAGTGLMAQALIIGLAKSSKPPQVVVLNLTALSKEVFYQGLERFASTLGLSMSSLPEVQLVTPKSGKSFGSTPRSVFNEIKKMAREEGILVDPIYSGKLFMTAREWVEESSKDLLIHSGGGLNLGGFLNRLS